MSKWLKNKFMGLMLALHKTESNIVMGDDDLASNTGQYQSHKQGMLSHSLINGEMTEEVKALRWRMYKVLNDLEGKNVKVVGQDERGFDIIETTEKDITSVGKAKGDPNEPFKVIMVVNNNPLEMGVLDAMEGKDIGEETSFDDFMTKIKTHRTINVERENPGSFNIEKYTKRLFIKQLEEEDEVLLEFFVSKYPDEEDRRSRLFLSELEKVSKGKRTSSIIDIQSVYFMSYKTAGVRDFHLFDFEILRFQNIVEYDGHQVIKFVAKKTTYNENLVEKYRDDKLDEKYEKKEKK